MNWPILLSKYRRSIFSDEKYLLLLALLERAGLATENDLHKMSGIALSMINNALVELRQDELIEFGANHMRLSEAGRRLVERLALHSDVIEDVLDDIALGGREREDFRTLLEAYRNTSFRLYQNSLCSLRQWKVLSSSFPIQSRRKQIAIERRAGMRCLLLRDFRNWSTHFRTEVPIDALETKILLSTILLHDVGQVPFSDCENEVDRFTVFFLHSLGACEEGAESTGKWASSVKLKSLFKDFHSFQASSEPDSWFDSWLFQFKFPNPDRFRSEKRYIDKLEESLRSHLSDVEPEEGKTDLLLRYVTAWKPIVTAPSIADSFLADLLVSRTLDELVERTHMPAESVKIVVTAIDKACTTVLAKDVAKQRIEPVTESED